MERNTGVREIYIEYVLSTSSRLKSLSDIRAARC